MFDTLTRQIAAALGKKYGSKSQKAFLAQCEAERDNANRIVNENTDQPRKLSFHAHQKELQAAIARGDLDKMDGYSWEEWQAEGQQFMAAGKAARRAASKKPCSVVNELAEEFAKDAEGFAAEWTKNEADAYARFGVPYPGPSALAVALRQAADYARCPVPRGEYADMRIHDMVPYVDF